MIGQALEQQGPGPWWTYVAMTATFDEARRMATDLAKRAGSHAWLHKSHDEYDPISVDDPLPSAETGAAPAR
jgi:hypothetical protein